MGFLLVSTMAGRFDKMSDWNFSELGRQIGQTVDDVLNSKEVKDLQKNIKNTVNSSVEAVRDSVTGAADSINRNVKWDKITPPPAPVKKQLPTVRTPGENALAAVMTILGGFGAGVFGFVAVVLFIAGVGSATWEAVLASLVLCIPWTVCAVISGRGRRIHKRVRRFKAYCRALGKKEFCSIRELADRVKKKETFVVKDLKKMMSDRWFPEGHLDSGNTCFMITDEAYEQYCRAENSRLEREKQEAEAEQEEKVLARDPETQEIRKAVAEGKKYIREIRRINDDIPGEEISRKLDRLELVTAKIFDQVEKHPDKLDDIQRFMEYYLPTTMKLLNKYREFDTQPVQGENIRRGKQEIEGTLDNINASFERLFDQLFQEEMLDVSTDIAVLSTMLAQAGLSGSDFEKRE